MGRPRFFATAIALGAVSCMVFVQISKEEPPVECEFLINAPLIEEPQKEAPLHADAPFDSDAFNGLIGIGGGAGGKFGGRLGGKTGRRVSSSAVRSSRTDELPPIHGFASPARRHLSTFAVDVDTAAYSNVRGYLNRGSTPPEHVVRLEELINYFRYDDPRPEGVDPIALHAEVAECPWQPQHRLVRVALSTRAISFQDTAPANLVFLIDTSGSMRDAYKLPLLQEGLRLLVEQLREEDRVAIVTYAGSSGIALASTPARERTQILATLENLEVRGGTNGSAGLRLAYEVARKNFVEGAVNRVLLATDGDFNIGVSKSEELKDLVRSEAASGISISVLGFGNIRNSDERLETIADNGDGNYTFIDSRKEARRALVEQMGATLVTVAKDVKIQLEFNPDHVQAWRQIGYENRQLQSREFRDDARDAGEMGAGHTTSALYEIVPEGVPFGGFTQEESSVTPDDSPRATFASQGEMLRIRVRWKHPDATAEDPALEQEIALSDRYAPWLGASDSFRFSASVALFGMVLRHSPYRGDGNLVLAEELGRSGQGQDLMGYRQEYLGLVRKALELGI